MKFQEKLNVVPNIIGTFFPDKATAEQIEWVDTPQEQIKRYIALSTWITKLIDDNSLMAPLCSI